MATISWNFNFPRNLNDRAVGKLVDLLSRLEHVSLVPTLEDKWVWAVYFSDSFSCKSFFDKLIDKSHIPLFPFHKKIWSACVPLKIKMFMWILVHRGMLTNDTLQRRPSRLDNLFVHCSVVASLWQMLFCLGNVMWVAPKESAQMTL